MIIKNHFSITIYFKVILTLSLPVLFCFGLLAFSRQTLVKTTFRDNYLKSKIASRLHQKVFSQKRGKYETSFTMVLNHFSEDQLD